MQDEAALHFEHDIGKALGVGTKFIGRSPCKRSGRSGIQSRLS
jgi:hypothetical protein